MKFFDSSSKKLSGRRAAVMSSPAAAAAAAPPSALDIEQAVLSALSLAGGEITSTADFAAATWGAASGSQAAVEGVCRSLEAEGLVAGMLSPQSAEHLELTAEGADYAAAGSPEARLLAALPPPPESLDEAALAALLASLQLAPAAATLAKGRAMKARALLRDAGPTGRYRRAAELPARDEVAEALRALAAAAAAGGGGGGAPPPPLDKAMAKELASRSLVTTVRRTWYRITRGAAYAPTRQRLAAELTKEMLDSGDWAGARFKAYNLESAGKVAGGGHLHALMKVRAEFRSILLEMG